VETGRRSNFIGASERRIDVPKPHVQQRDQIKPQMRPKLADQAAGAGWLGSDRLHLVAKAREFRARHAQEWKRGAIRGELGCAAWIESLSLCNLFGCGGPPPPRDLQLRKKAVGIRRRRRRLARHDCRAGNLFGRREMRRCSRFPVRSSALRARGRACV
jgi:hypothetical protein